MEELSSTKPVPGAKEVGDHWYRERYTYTDDPQLKMVQLTIFTLTMVWKQYTFSEGYTSNFECWCFHEPVMCGMILSYDVQWQWVGQPHNWYTCNHYIPRKPRGCDGRGDKTYHPPGWWLCLPSTWSPELLGPGKGTKLRPNQVRTFGDNSRTWTWMA